LLLQFFQFPQFLCIGVVIGTLAVFVGKFADLSEAFGNHLPHCLIQCIG